MSNKLYFSAQISIILVLFATRLSAQIVTTIAGDGMPSYGGDGGPATAAHFRIPTAIAVDKAGNTYTEADSRLRMINTSGIINTIAGTGAYSYSGDGGPATAATFVAIHGMLHDTSGNLIITNLPCIRKIDPYGIVSIVAGTPSVFGYSGDGGPATLAALHGPNSIAIDDSANIYFADGHNHCVRKVNTAGVITTIAGNGTLGFSGDGGPATDAQLNGPSGVAVDHKGNIYIGDAANYRIRKVEAETGIISTIAGSGPIFPVTGTYTGEGGPATDATFIPMVSLAIDDIGNLYIAGSNKNIILKLSTTGIITTIAGTGIAGFSGDGGPATAATFNYISGVTLDDTGNIYLADRSNNRLRKISSGNRLPLFAGDAVQYLYGCKDAATPVDYLLQITDADTGQSLTWTIFDAPLHGTLSSGYSAVSTGGAITPAGITYMPAAGYTGADTFRIRVDDGISADFTTVFVRIDTVPYVGLSSGPDSVCPGDNILLSNATPGGSWSSGDDAIATVDGSGTVTGMTSGSTTITYSIANACDTIFTIRPVWVKDCPSAVHQLTGDRYALSIRPNPSSDGRLYVTVTSAASETAHFSICDVRGKVVMRGYVPVNRTTPISLAVPEGCYYLRVTTAVGQFNKCFYVRQ